MSFNVNNNPIDMAQFAAQMAIDEIVSKSRSQARKAAGGTGGAGGATVGSLGAMAAERTQTAANSLQSKLSALPDDANFKEIQMVQTESQKFQSLATAMKDAISSAGQTAQKAGSKN